MVFSGNIGILAATLSFILGMMMMGNSKKAVNGNLILVIGMITAIAGTIFIQIGSNTSLPWINILLILVLILIGTLIGGKVSFGFQLTKMPELVSLFNGFGGLAAALIGIVGIIQASNLESTSHFILLASIFLGFMTFSASLVAFFKLGGRFRGAIANNQAYTIISLVLCLLLIIQLLIFPFDGSYQVSLILLIVLSMLHGLFFASAIGGGDMPILISILNGLTGALTLISGIYFESTIMILSGVFVGATGIILTQQMCQAMNTSLIKVIFRTNTASVSSNESGVYAGLNETSATRVAADLTLVKKVVIVPGFGLAVSKAQKLCKELKDQLALSEIELKFVIHPVAGRMPGHMNVLLAEAGIAYSDILDLAKGNEYLTETDLCLVIGANDVVNTLAENDEQSSIYGMPIIQTYKAKKVVVIKRSLSPGYAGIKNPLFENQNSQMLFVDAKDALSKILTELKMN